MEIFTEFIRKEEEFYKNKQTLKDLEKTHDILTIEEFGSPYPIEVSSDKKKGTFYKDHAELLFKRKLSHPGELTDIYSKFSAGFNELAVPSITILPPRVVEDCPNIYLEGGELRAKFPDESHILVEAVKEGLQIEISGKIMRNKRIYEVLEYGVYGGYNRTSFITTLRKVTRRTVVNPAVKLSKYILGEK